MNLVEEAIAHFKYGISHDIFKPPVVKYVFCANSSIFVWINSIALFMYSFAFLISSDKSVSLYRFSASNSH